MTSVVIPVYNCCNYTNQILSNIFENSEIPNEIIIIDNGSTDSTENVIKNWSLKLNIRYLKLRKNIGVNRAWNIGIKLAKHEIISVLNNDLILNKNFFLINRKTFEKYPECGMTYCKTLHRAFDEEDITKYIEKVKSYQFTESSSIRLAKYRMGWAFSIRKFLSPYLKIPKILFNYCGDDFHYTTIKNLGYSIYLMKDNWIFHYEGATGKYFKLRDRMHEDTLRWNKMMGI